MLIFLSIVILVLVYVYFQYKRVEAEESTKSPYGQDYRSNPSMLGTGTSSPGNLQTLSTEYVPGAFVVLDLETTGLDPFEHSIIEIAAIKFQKGTEKHQTIQALVKFGGRIPNKITELTGITQEMLEREGSPLDVALREFSEFAGDLPLVTFNADFDMGFLHAGFSEVGLPKLDNTVSCALKMARRAWPGRKSYRLTDLSRDGGIDTGTAHRALEDARRALLIYVGASTVLKSSS